MALINVSVKHGKTLEEARAHLPAVVSEVQGRFGPMIQRVEWTGDRSGVKLFGIGFEAEVRVDATDVHLSGDLPFLGNLLGGPLGSGLKSIVQRAFQKQLPSGKV